MADIYHLYEALSIGQRAQMASLASQLVAFTAVQAHIAAIVPPLIALELLAMAMGSGYQAARNLARDENVRSGFSQGFVTGLLGWEWSHTVRLLGRHGVIRVSQTDEALNVIRVNSYNQGMRVDFSSQTNYRKDGRKHTYAN